LSEWALKEILGRLIKCSKNLIGGMIGEHLRYLSDFFSAIVKCIWKKYSKKVLIWSLQSLAAAASIQKNGKKSLQCLWPPKLLQSLHQINLTVFFIFHFLSLDSIDYIMIILELISPQTAHYWAKILAYYTKKITIIKKKRRPNIVTALLPARDQLQKQQKKSQFLVNWPDKKHKKNTKIWPTPHLYNWLAKRIVSVYGF